MIALLFALTAGPRPCLAFLPSDTKEIPDCVSTDARGAMVVGASARKQLAFEDGLATISVDGAFFYVDRRGKTARALTFDNGPDPFVEGLARTIENGKVGFLDRKLRTVSCRNGISRSRSAAASPSSATVAARTPPTSTAK